MKLRKKPVWVSAERCRLGENPLWDANTGELYWMNIADPAVFRLKDRHVTTYDCPKPIGSVYLAGHGRLLVAMRPGFAWLDLASSELSPIEANVTLAPDERFNDGRCDRHGTIWITTFDRKVERPIGSLVRFGGDFRGVATPAHAIIGNGVCFEPADTGLYFSDSRGRAIYRYPKEGDVLGPRELLVALDGHPGRPDGCTVDAEGCLWSARIGGGRIDRYLPDGRLIDTLELPVASPTHCTFGGPDLKTLFVTTANFAGEEPAGSDLALAGAVMAFELDVAGTAEHSVAMISNSNQETT